MVAANKILSSKEVLIETFEIAEINFLQSFKGIKSEIVTQQFHDDVNHIAWIIGHCISHMDLYLSVFSKERKLTDKQRKYHAYGVSKDEIEQFPFSFNDLIDIYLSISEEFFGKLKILTDEDFHRIKIPDNNENLKHMMQRITLHFMGHTGQIVLLRRIFDDPFWSFVGGVSKNNRDKLRKDWIEWWEENKEAYN
ncbi:MAG: DinB family protein [Asgard group archaeon]|nr:DinB family protein [Asgard group archaeon]